jgi:succinoglycan biosynthesis transport protein ExoP
MGGRQSVFADYMDALRRRKWLLLGAVVVITALALAVSSREQRMYAASAEVLLNQSPLSGTSGGGSSNTADAARYDETQAQVAETQPVATLALRSLHLTSVTTNKLLSESVVTADGTSDVLTFTVTTTSKASSKALVNAYAKSFTLYRRTLDTASITSALKGLDSRLHSVQDRYNVAQRAHAVPPSLRQELSRLIRQDQNMRTVLSLQTGDAVFAKHAEGATLTQPKLVRNTVLGAFLGLIVGIGLVVLRELLDTRVRGSEEIVETIGTPLMGRLPTPARKLRSGRRLVMLSGDTSGQEAYRQIRVALDFANIATKAKSIMITSAVELEGKSTTAANLAVAVAKTGRRVILVDLDLRRPVLHTFFQVPGAPGLAEVMLGQIPIESALVPVQIPSESDEPQPPLSVLAAGSVPYNPADLLERGELADLLKQLEARADLVVIDSPPLLPVSDAVTLSGHVGAVILMVRAGTTRRPVLRELGRMLTTMRCQVFGFVLTGAETEAGYGGYYGSSYHAVRPAPPRPDPAGEVQTSI